MHTHLLLLFDHEQLIVLVARLDSINVAHWLLIVSKVYASRNICSRMIQYCQGQQEPLIELQIRIGQLEAWRSKNQGDKAADFVHLRHFHRRTTVGNRRARCIRLVKPKPTIIPTKCTQ